MPIFPTKKNKPVVGLAIESDGLAAAELEVNGKVEVKRHGVAPLAPGIVREGEVVDVEALGEALKELFSQNKLSTDVRLGIANQRLAVRMLHVPVIENRDELETAIRFQAQEHVPMPLEQAVLDWEVIGTTQGASGEPQLAVVVAAARRDMIERLLTAMRAGGLTPVGIDVSAFGLIRAVARDGHLAASQPSYEERAAAEQEGDAVAQTPQVPARMLCYLGDITNLAAARGPDCLFTRLASFGLEGMAQRLAERRELSLEQARQWITHVGLAAPTGEIEGEPEIVEATRAVLEEGVARLADEVRASVEYYATQEGAVALENVIAIGPGTTVPGLVERLQAVLGYPFAVVCPSALSRFDQTTAARLTLPFGLALEE